MAKHRYRCNSKTCRTRVTLRKRKEEYIKVPICKECGSNIHSVEKERRDYAKRVKCTCDGLHFPHQTGTKWCNYYKGEYDEHDLRERHLA